MRMVRRRCEKHLVEAERAGGGALARASPAADAAAHAADHVRVRKRRARRVRRDECGRAVRVVHAWRGRRRRLLRRACAVSVRLGPQTDGLA